MKNHTHETVWMILGHKLSKRGLLGKWRMWTHWFCRSITGYIIWVYIIEYKTQTFEECGKAMLECWEKSNNLRDQKSNTIQSWRMPFIHPSCSTHLGLGHIRQERPDLLLPSHFIQLFQWDPELFPGQPIVSAKCSGCSPGTFPSGSWVENLN